MGPVMMWFWVFWYWLGTDPYDPALWLSEDER